MSDETAAAPAATPAPSALASVPAPAAEAAAPAAIAAPAEAAPVEAAKETKEALKPAELPGPLGEKFKAFAKEHGIADTQQSKLAEFYAGIQSEAQKASDAEFAKMDAAFRDTLRADPVIGGQNYDASIATARKGVEWAGGSELSRILEATGLGNHPTLVKAFHKLGKSLSEDSVAGSSSQGAAAPSEAEVLADLYPSMFPKH